MHDKYLSYDPDELVADESFISYVMDPKSNEAKEWNAWIERNPTMSEKVNEARNVLSSLQIKSINTEGAADRIWSRIENSVSEQPTTAAQPRKIRPLHIIGAIAAGLAILIAFRLMNTGMSMVQAEYGQSLTISLPDASTVQINDGSELTYNTDDFESARSVTLKGEAFFEVEKGTSFKVETEVGTVTVLGTSFNVFSRANSFRVHCHTGSVKVEHQASSVILKPGEMTILDKVGELNVAPFDIGIEKDWRSGVFSYEKTPLKQVFEEIERQYDVRIRTSKEIYAQTYTGFFGEESLEEALHSVCWPLKLHAEIDEKRVLISK